MDQQSIHSDDDSSSCPSTDGEMSPTTTPQHTTYEKLCSNLSCHSQSEQPSTITMAPPEIRGDKGQRARERFSKLFFVRQVVLRGRSVIKPPKNENQTTPASSDDTSDTRQVTRNIHSVPDQLSSKKTNNNSAFRQRKSSVSNTQNDVFGSFTSSSNSSAASSSRSSVMDQATSWSSYRRRRTSAVSQSAVFSSSAVSANTVCSSGSRGGGADSSMEILRNTQQGPNPFSFF